MKDVKEYISHYKCRSLDPDNLKFYKSDPKTSSIQVNAFVLNKSGFPTSNINLNRGSMCLIQF